MPLINCLATTPELAEVFSDANVLRAMLRFESALAIAQARLGIIPESAARAIAKIDAVDPTGLAAAARHHATLVIPFVQMLTEGVRKIDAQAAEYVHHGTTSQDVLDTALILLLRETREIFMRDHARLRGDLRALSDRHRETVMRARTLLQPALATTFGYKVAIWFGGIERSWRNLSRAFDDALQLQFGGPAGTLDAFKDRAPTLAEELARELRLRATVPWHTSRDRLAMLIADCGIYTASLAKIARDVALLMQPEIGELSERGGGSSSMPHKRNPSQAVVVLAAATRLPGLVSAFLNAIPQEHERAAGGWQSEWPTIADAIQSTGSALAAAAEMIAGLTINAERMKTNLNSSESTGSAEYFRERLLEE